MSDTSRLACADALPDGCSRLQILFRMVLPLSVPGLLSAGIFCFTLCWNEFLYALIFMSSGPMKTIPGMYKYMDLPDIVSMNCPGGLMVINGTQDLLFPLDGVKRSFEKIAKVYQKAGVPEKFEGVLFPGHAGEYYGFAPHRGYIFAPLERFEGHLLNWYNTRTLEPLVPRYVSTVDSGNLLASLWTLVQGYREMLSRLVIGPQALQGLADTLALVVRHQRPASGLPRRARGS